MWIWRRRHWSLDQWWFIGKSFGSDIDTKQQYSSKIMYLIHKQWTPSCLCHSADNWHTTCGDSLLAFQNCNKKVAKKTIAIRIVLLSDGQWIETYWDPMQLWATVFILLIHWLTGISNKNWNHTLFRYAEQQMNELSHLKKPQFLLTECFLIDYIYINIINDNLKWWMILMEQR